MKKMWLLIFLVCVLTLSACGKDEADSDITNECVESIEVQEETLVQEVDNTSIQDDSDTQGGFALPNPYPEGYQTNETAFDNLFSGHFANMSAPMGLEPGCTFESSKRFALKASYDMEDPINGAYYLFIVDVLGNVYDMIPVTKYPMTATGWLKDDIFYCSDGSSAHIMKQGGDITENFFEDDISLIDVVNDSNGIMFFTAKTVFDSPYDSMESITDEKYDVWDDSGRIILTFYKNELVNKYGIESWLSTGSYHLINLGSGIYHVSNRYKDNSNPQYIFIDVNRKKAFAVPVNDDAIYEDIETDGNYILIPHNQTEAVTIFDIETEKYVYIENISKAYGLGEGKFFTDMYCYSVHGDIVFAYEDMNLRDEIIKAGAYHDGQALIITDGGKYYQSIEHEYGIGLIDETGSNVNDIATLSGTRLLYSYVQDLDTYCVFSDQGSGGFLSNTNNFQQQSIYGSSDADYYYGVVDNDNHLILRYGYIGKDYSDEIRATETFGYELFETN